jgi:hypothetical protein
VTRRTHAADRVLEQRVAREDLAVDDERDHPARVARRVHGPHRQAAYAQLVAGVEVAGRAVDQLALVGVDQHLRAGEAVRHRRQVRDVVVVVVGQQDVGHGDVVRRRLLQQRAHRAARVDEEAVAARRGRDEVGVRQPVRVHRALDDHGAEATPAGGSTVPAWS